MQSFSDKKGQTWEIELTVGIMEKVKDELDIDLFDPVSDERQLIVELAPIGAENIRLFFSLLFVLCQDECKEKEISSSDFKMLMGPEAVREAYEAFYQEWELFFQSLGRKDQAAAIQKMNSLIQEGVEKATMEIEKTTLVDLKSQTTNSVTS